jgi:hypothetical protein
VDIFEPIELPTAKDARVLKLKPAAGPLEYRAFFISHWTTQPGSTRTRSLAYSASAANRRASIPMPGPLMIAAPMGMASLACTLGRFAASRRSVGAIEVAPYLNIMNPRARTRHVTGRGYQPLGIMKWQISKTINSSAECGKAAPTQKTSGHGVTM